MSTLHLAGYVGFKVCGGLFVLVISGFWLLCQVAVDEDIILTPNV